MSAGDLNFRACLSLPRRATFPCDGRAGLVSATRVSPEPWGGRRATKQQRNGQDNQAEDVLVVGTEQCREVLPRMRRWCSASFMAAVVRPLSVAFSIAPSRPRRGVSLVDRLS